MTKTYDTRSGLYIGLLASFMLTLTSPVTGWTADEHSSQALFASPDQAVAALNEAVKLDDTNALEKVLGPAVSEITNPDPVQRAHYSKTFAKHLADFTELAKQEDGTVVLRVGQAHWPFPIPLTMKGDKWFFDTMAGKEEILNRRIGHNEISAIEICHAYVKAQRDYLLKDYDGNGVTEYAQRMQSTSGKKDGLYWEITTGEEVSPFGPLVARACEEGYSRRSVSASPRKHDPFHGYIFRILKRQGKHAPGGTSDYVINDHMVAGFAFLAYPVQWGNSGVMTFIVNQEGKVYQKNLGEKTADLAATIPEYDPDDSWKIVE